LKNIFPSPAYQFIYPFSREAITRFATYFVYEYKEPQHVDDYVVKTVEAVRKWCREHKQCFLLSCDNGHQLVIVDQRPIAKRKFYAFNGLKRAIYNQCDSSTSLPSLARRMKNELGRQVNTLSIERILQEMIDNYLMVEEKGKFLGLCVQVTGAKRQARIMAQFNAHIEFEKQVRWRKQLRKRVIINKL
jgi:hypothetical protein